MNINFKTISYTSTLLWHFVRGAGTTNEERAQSSFDTITSFILKSDGSGSLLCIPPTKSPFHPRLFQLEQLGQLGKGEDDFTSDIQHNLQEPRSVCFADIPINHLPIHIKLYYGIGFGFRRDVLSEQVPDLKPVEYFPRNSTFTLNEACTKTNSGYELKKYAKVPSQDEPFLQIYNEREWRSFQNIVFGANELAIIFFPTRNILTKALSDDKFKLLFSKGVGFICGEDLYETSKES